jgi:predicted ATP-binding protein involved in virulence
MILHKLNLVNFRAFEQIEMAFEPGVNVIAGVNGVGKSSLLRAMATGLSHVMPMMTPSGIPPLSLADEDVTLDKSAASITLELSFDEEAISATVQRLLADRPERRKLSKNLEAMRGEKRRVAQPTLHLQRLEQLKVKRLLQGLRGALAESGDRFNFEIKGLRLPKGTMPDVDAIKEATEIFVKSLRERPNQPVAIFCSPHRLLGGKPRKLPAITPFTIPSAYPRALEDVDVDLRDFMGWFRYHEQHRRGRAGVVLDQLSEVVTRFVPEFGKLRIEDEPVLRFVVEKQGKPFGLHQLSDGERGLLAMLFDITRRLAIANPELTDPISQGKAVVMIDEIELHLHPKWQRTALHSFTNTFKKCQFIVTTHSPQVLGEVEHERIQLLTRNSVGRITRWKPAHSFGLDSSRVLEELMKVNSRNEQLDQELSQLFEQIDLEKFPNARRLIKHIAIKLGENDPEITRARSLISFLEGEK